MVKMILIPVIIIELVIAIAVGRDASRRYNDGSSAPFCWFIAVLFIPLLFIPYLIVRPER